MDMLDFLYASGLPHSEEEIRRAWNEYDGMITSLPYGESAGGAMVGEPTVVASGYDNAEAGPSRLEEYPPPLPELSYSASSTPGSLFARTPPPDMAYDEPMEDYNIPMHAAIDADSHQEVQSQALICGYIMPAEHFPAHWANHSVERSPAQCHAPNLPNVDVADAAVPPRGPSPAPTTPASLHQTLIPAPSAPRVSSHPNAPNWPHPVDAFITVLSPTEDLVRLCTMVSCPGCEQVHPAETVGSHYRTHFKSCKAGDKVTCSWDGCSTEVSYRGLKNHVDDIHLKILAQHCPYCHRTRRSDKSHDSGHIAADCPSRKAALNGTGTSKHMLKRCKVFCPHRRDMGRDSLPEYRFPHKYRACISGPAVPPQGPPAGV